MWIGGQQQKVGKICRTKLAGKPGHCHTAGGHNVHCGWAVDKRTPRTLSPLMRTCSWIYVVRDLPDSWNTLDTMLMLFDASDTWLDCSFSSHSAACVVRRNFAQSWGNGPFL